MLAFTIRSFQGVGPLKFDMTREEVRRVLSGKIKEFMKTPTSESMSDLFVELEIVAFYDKDDRLKAVEFGGKIIPSWNGIVLMGRPVAEIFADVKPQSVDLEIDEYGAIFHDLGFGFYLPGWLEEAAEPPQGIIAFRRSYYQRHAAKPAK